MDKIIVEKPRHGSRDGEYASRRERRNARQSIRHGDDFDSHYFDSKQNIGRHIRGAGGKELNENLKPLARFIAKNVGRPWNKVYSEIRATINPNNAVQAHILQHVDDYVEKHIRMIDGKPFQFIGHRSWALDRSIDGWLPMTATPGRHYNAYYIHPENGLLCKAPEDAGRRTRFNYRKHEFRDDVCGHETDPTIFYKQINGIWYEVFCRVASPEEQKGQSFGYYYEFPDSRGNPVKSWHTRVLHPSVVDVAPGTEYSGSLWQCCAAGLGVEGMFPLRKRQISKREIKNVKNRLAQLKMNRQRRAA